MNYDAIIVGAGPAGIFAALELTGAGKRVLIVDKGRLIRERICPIMAGQADRCVNCPSCAVVSGWGGAGSASDGKLTITTGYGGNLEEYVGTAELERLMKAVDDRFVADGADPHLYEPSGQNVHDTIRRAAAAGIKVLPARIRHIGTDASREVLDAMYRSLRDKCDILMNTFVQDILVENGAAVGVVTSDGTEHRAADVIVAPGRDRVRTFCMNPSGFVVSEFNRTHGLVTVNGHSLKNTKSRNTNFAVLVTKNFTRPFTDPIGYATHIARLANMLAGGGLLVQRLGDLRDGRRSTPDRIARGMIEPTGPAVPGDLSLVLPHRHMTDIVEFLDALNVIMPGVNQNDTLLYGVEIKLYSLRLELKNNLAVPNVKHLYMAGDGAGVSRGIIQAAASGLVAGRAVLGA